MVAASPQILFNSEIIFNSSFFACGRGTTSDEHKLVGTEVRTARTTNGSYKRRVAFAVTFHVCSPTWGVSACHVFESCNECDHYAVVVVKEGVVQ